MKKKIIALSLLMAVLILAFGVSVLATSGDDITTCGECGATLLEGATHINSYNTTHTVYYFGQFETCTVTHDRSRVERFCPDGHGVRWTGIWHYLWHSHPYCTDTGYWE